MRRVSPEMQAALNRRSSTITRLLRVTLTDGRIYGMAQTNVDVHYEHMDGGVLYHASQSFDPTQMDAAADGSVTNSDATALISDDISLVTPELIRTGGMRGAEWALFMVDYSNPVANSAIVLDAGKVGQVKLLNDDAFTLELLSYSFLLRQPVGQSYSRRNRAILGNPANTPLGDGVDIAPLWWAFTVTAVGAETDVMFTMDATPGPGSRPFYPGRVEWLTGRNAGFKASTMEYNAGVVTLATGAPYPIEVGDTGRIRPDTDGTIAAAASYGALLEFKGEPFIPDDSDVVPERSIE